MFSEFARNADLLHLEDAVAQGSWRSKVCLDLVECDLGVVAETSHCSKFVWLVCSG